LCGTLDVYVKLLMVNTRFRVFNNGDDDYYKWQTETRGNVSPGIVDFGGQTIPDDGSNLQKAAWIFNDMNEAWNYGTVYGHDPGDIRCQYPISNDLYARTSSSASHPARMFISPNASDEREVVVHEYGHALLKNANLMLPGGPHTIYQSVSEGLAWSEGWAHFYAFAVWNAPIINIDPTDFDDSKYYVNLDLETFAYVDNVGDYHDFPDDVPTGATNEARVAGALWDILDYTNDNFDQYGYGFAGIYDIVWEDRPMGNLNSFWNAWKSRFGAPSNEAHGAVSAIYNNTIDSSSTGIMINYESGHEPGGETVYSKHNDIWNNIITNTTVAIATSNDDNIVDLYSDYNCVYNTNDYSWMTVVMELAEWQDSTFRVARNSDTLSCNTITNDPLYNAGNHVYTLQSGSPCIGTGKDTLGYDDMGAFDYTAPSSSKWIRLRK